MALYEKNFGQKNLVPWDTLGVPGPHISQSEKGGPLIFGVQTGLHLPLLESGPTSYGQGPRCEHFVSDAVTAF